MSTPDLYLQTSFILNDGARIVSTREPGAIRGPLFSLVRSAAGCAWAVHADLPNELACELDRLAQKEPPASDLHDTPLHARQYLALVGAQIGSGHEPAAKTTRFSGPAFTFPDGLAMPAGVMLVEDEQLLAHSFSGWVPGELSAGRSPALAIFRAGYPVSVCFCARRSDAAAEAGLETAVAFRGGGFGPLVAAAWALTIRATGRIPLYSTSWTNRASLSVARTLGLDAYASIWSLFD